MPCTRHIVALVLMLGASACNLGNLFKSAGAACITDANCPSSLACCDGTCQADCSSGGSVVASVTLVTDWVPGYQFDAIEVKLDGQARALDVTVTYEFLNPIKIAEYGEVPGGSQHDVSVVLSYRGAQVVQRNVIFSATADVTVAVVITRDCNGVGCSERETCVAGSCVNAICSSLNAQFCPAAECSADADCAGSVPCAVGYCYEGMCLEKRQDALCDADERCLPTSGCTVKVPECANDNDCTDGIECTREVCDSSQACTSIRDDSLCAKTVCDPTAPGADAKTGCTQAPCSADTCIPGPCETASCVDNKCARVSNCGTGESCCAGNVCATNCNDPRACAGRAAGYICRPAVGACDTPETCDGTSDACPADQVYAAGQVCRERAGMCDLLEACDGVSPSCPADVLRPAGAECREVTGECDVAEYCNGSSAACPTNVFASAATECRASAGPCDVRELCTGTGRNCPGDSFQSSSTVCRGEAPGGCDVAEYCTGASAGCPGDSFRTGVCRPSAGGCDPAESCPGNSAQCPGDARTPAGTVCRGQSGECDVAEACNGGVECPPDGVRGAGAQCRPSYGVCDRIDVCDGANKGCADQVQDGSVLCRSPRGCSPAAYCGGAYDCPGEVIFSDGRVCNPGTSQCDIDDICTGASADCVPRYAGAGTPCGGGSDGLCNLQDTCDGGAGCIDNRRGDGVSCSTHDTCGGVCSGGVCTGYVACAAARVCCEDAYCTTTNICNGTGPCPRAAEGPVTRAAVCP